jgi:hypothetical protein
MRRSRSLLVCALALSLSLVPSVADADDEKKKAVEAPGRVIPPPDEYYSYQGQRAYPSLAWWITQLIPSPEFAVGRVTNTGLDGVPQTSNQVAFGLRWQVTPILWSWGTNRNVSRWRVFVADPLARHAGSIELDGTLEYVWGHVDRFLARPGIRATVPIYGKGEYVSMAIGTSTYRYDGTMRVAYDAGIYFLYGIFGLQTTIAPAHDPLTAIGTFRIRYF